MAAFDRFKQKVQELEAQGYEVSPETSSFVDEYESQADRAERLLKERQARARSDRSRG